MHRGHGGLEILPSLLQQARDDGLKLEIRIDARANTVVIKDSRGGQTWVAAERYLDAMGAQRHGTEVAMSEKLWNGLCKSRGLKPSSYEWKYRDEWRDNPAEQLEQIAKEWDECHADVLTLKQLIARTILRGREELER